MHDYMKTKNETMYKAEDFLADVDFTMWALNPDKGAGDFWSGYVSRFPENRAEFEKALRSARSIRFNHCEVDPERKDRLQESIMSEYRMRVRARARRRRELLLSACAACVLAAVAVAALWNTGRRQLCDPDAVSRLAAAHNIIFTTGGGRCYEADCDMMQIYCMADGRISIVGGGERVVKPSRRAVNELIVPEGRKAFVTLGDGSTVWVNSGTVVRFPSAFERHRRRMFAEGEIYIEVARREEAPFTLFSGGGNSVRVLGTQFGVKSSGHNSYSVVLAEGSVEVNIADRERLKLAPSQMFSYYNGSYAVRTVDTDDYLRWKDGILLFSTDSLQEILSQIARTYDVEIVSDSLVDNMKCSGKLIITDSLDNTLDVLSDIVPIDWVHEGNRVEIRAR